MFLDPNAGTPAVNNLSLTTPRPVQQGDPAQAVLRARMAQGVLDQALQPLQPSPAAGGYAIPISPWAGLAKLLMAYSAANPLPPADQPAGGASLPAGSRPWAGADPGDPPTGTMQA